MSDAVHLVTATPLFVAGNISFLTAVLHGISAAAAPTVRMNGVPVSDSRRVPNARIRLLPMGSNVEAVPPRLYQQFQRTYYTTYGIDCPLITKLDTRLPESSLGLVPVSAPDVSTIEEREWTPLEDRVLVAVLPWIFESSFFSFIPVNHMTSAVTPPDRLLIPALLR